MKKRHDAKSREVARRTVLERFERDKGPVGFHRSASYLAKKIAEAGVRLDKVSLEKAIRHYRKTRELEWRRTSTIQAN